MASNWESNSNGLGTRVHYNERDLKDFGGTYSAKGTNKKELQYTVDLSEVAYTVQSGAATIVLTNPAGGGEMEPIVPAYSLITGVKVKALTALASTGMSAAANVDLLVGLDKASDGTAIDADGLIDATDGAVTLASNNISHAAGDVFVGSNAALVPNVDIGADAGQLYAAFSVDDDTGLTGLSGKVQILVEYEEPQVDGQGNYTAGGLKA